MPKTRRKKRPIAVCLEFHCENARTVCIAGTFNDWSPEKASDARDRSRAVDQGVVLAAGALTSISTWWTENG